MTKASLLHRVRALENHHQAIGDVEYEWEHLSPEEQFEFNLVVYYLAKFAKETGDDSMSETVNEFESNCQEIIEPLGYKVSTEKFYILNWHLGNMQDPNSIHHECEIVCFTDKEGKPIGNNVRDAFFTFRVLN